MNVIQKLGNKILIMDGAMGTMLQDAGLKPGQHPESLNLFSPEAVKCVHLRYLAAGADIIETNTFGANEIKLNGSGLNSDEVVAVGVRLALEAIEESGREAYAALSIGPTGKLIKPLGDLDFEQAVRAFSSQAAAGAKAGADLIVVETMSDVYEIKAALLGIKEACDLPVIVTMSFDKNGRLLTGADVLTAATVAESLGANAVGFNCGLGPEQMIDLIPSLIDAVNVPVAINPNAGLPELVNGVTHFNVGPDEFARHARRLAELGASILGGCCGTTPEHIAALKSALDGMSPAMRKPVSRTVVTSYSRSVELGKRPVVIGERINPTGKPRLKRALRENDMDHILHEGVSQAEAGAQILDVNCGLPGIDEAAMLAKVMLEIQKILPLPLQLDTADPYALERAARLYNGRPIINSVNGKQESMDVVFPIVKKYGAAVIALTLDENGIPETAAGRFDIARRIVSEAERYGIRRQDIIVDPLTLTVSAGPENALVTLEALRMIREELGVNTALGVSNVSFGLPARDAINSVFFAMALQAGLSAGIINPLSKSMMDTLSSFNALTNGDPGMESYINRFSEDSMQPDSADPACTTLKNAIIKGLKNDARELAKSALAISAPLDIINDQLVPALNIVGEGFEKNRVFLPQLLLSAEAANAAFEQVRSALPAGQAKLGKVVLATVKGDVHDIGKNIVASLLENYGFEVIDLGRDVAAKDIVEAARSSGASLVGLSALMTTTVGAMEESIKALRQELDVKIAVGGAVLTADYAEKIGADRYCSDAMATVRYALEVYERQ